MTVVSAPTNIAVQAGPTRGKPGGLNPTIGSFDIVNGNKYENRLPDTVAIVLGSGGGQTISVYADIDGEECVVDSFTAVANAPTVLRYDARFNDHSSSCTGGNACQGSIVLKQTSGAAGDAKIAVVRLDPQG